MTLWFLRRGSTVNPLLTRRYYGLENIISLVSHYYFLISILSANDEVFFQELAKTAEKVPPVFGPRTLTYYSQMNESSNR